VKPGPLLVTGSTGLIGAPLVKALERESIEAHCVSRTPRLGPMKHQADLTSPEQTRHLIDRVRPSVIIHLAGGREPSLERLYESNLLTTINLLNAAARLDPPPAFILTGSAAEYGEPLDGIAYETGPTEPLTDYGRVKSGASIVARTLADSAGMPMCIVRPFNVVSPDLAAAVALGNMRQQLLSQTGHLRSVTCGRLDIVRDYVPLLFVVDVFVHLVDASKWPPVLNVCSGIGIELGEILLAMAEILDVEVRVIADPGLAAIPAADRIIGETSGLRELGLHCRPTASSLARILVGQA